MDWQFESMNGLMGGGMWLFWLILLIVIVFLVKQFMAPSQPPESTLELLKKRYARGEINKEEFEEIKKTLLS
jgi:putative membrane protein